ncbi:P-loop containing nucleoside triphosphate hydrolase protein, partial [Leucogyrophana mollusca]
DGVCANIPNCKLLHHTRRCSCQAIVAASQLEQHLRGRKHSAQLNSLPGASRSSGPSLTNGQDALSPTPSVEDAGIRCDVLALGALSLNFRRIRRDSPQSAAAEDPAPGTGDDHGIEVSPDVDFGVIDIEPALRRPMSTRRTLRITMHTEGRVDLTSLRLQSTIQQDSLFSCIPVQRSRVVQKGYPRDIVINFNPSYEGLHQDTLELCFRGHRTDEIFSVHRQLHAIVGSQADHERLKSRGSYIKLRRVNARFRGPTISPTRPPGWTAVQWVRKFKKFKIPKSLVKASQGHDGLIKSTFMPATFDLKTYGDHFGVLLYLEELQLRHKAEKLTLEDVEFTADYPTYKVPIPGLGEMRPSVLIGDYILVKRPQDLPDDVSFKGRVHKVHQEGLSVHFSTEFNTYRGKVFNVRFLVNHMPWQRMHAAVTTPEKPQRLLFPEPSHVRGARVVVQGDTLPFEPLNPLIAQNPEQVQTVAAILSQPPGSVPFVIFGPFGTGKTSTVVEAIHQLLNKDPAIRILACAPSNAAADTLARLLNLNPEVLFRLNATWRKPETTPTILRPFTLLNGNGFFAIPSLERLEGFRVIVSTCVSGGVPWGMGMKRGHFSHIIIDEAGQAMEPAAVIPILTMADARTNVILAGDHQQLGPICHSHIAKTLGLSTSYLARLTERPIYNLVTGRGLTSVVKLLQNFRNHPAIIRFSDDTFYGGELSAAGDPLVINSLLGSNLVQNNFPVLFHSINGKDERETGSPSYFNISDASIVKRYCETLVQNDGVARTAPEDIGVITPYNAQRLRIEALLEGKLSGITVGTVEEFQGQERRVIVISTVRSNDKHTNGTIRHALGFVSDPRRMNVTLTRAQALLVVVGNPLVLGLDPFWRTFLSYVHRGGGWRGTPDIGWDPHETAHPTTSDYQQRAQADGEILVQRLQSVVVDPTNRLAAPEILDA